MGHPVRAPHYTTSQLSQLSTACPELQSLALHLPPVNVHKNDSGDLLDLLEKWLCPLITLSKLRKLRKLRKLVTLKVMTWPAHHKPGTRSLGIDSEVQSTWSPLRFDAYMASLVPFAQQVFTLFDCGAAKAHIAVPCLNVLSFGQQSHWAEWDEGGGHCGRLRTPSATTNFWRHTVRGTDGQLSKGAPKLVSHTELKYEGEPTKVLQSKNLCFAPREGRQVNGGFEFEDDEV